VRRSLIKMVRDKIDAGVLPLDAPVKLWLGTGSGQPCTVCGQRVLADEMEYEPQYNERGIVIRLHSACHRLWEAERRRRRHASHDC